jgi:hypothetical protein
VKHEKKTPGQPAERFQRKIVMPATLTLSSGYLHDNAQPASSAEEYVTVQAEVMLGLATSVIASQRQVIADRDRYIAFLSACSWRLPT